MLALGRVGLIPVLGASRMVQFQSTAEEIAATQQVAEDSLREVASSGGPIDDPLISRLEQLATASARLAYGNGLASILSETASNLIAWCDHLDDAEWRARFSLALKSYPLASPWDAPNNSFKPNPLRSFKTPSGFSGGSA
jgi:hypothetical protein